MLGCLFLWPGIITLVKFIGVKHPTLAIWGGMFTILGLIGRVFHGGIDHMAFQLVNVQSLELATKAVSDSYQAFHIVRYLNGWMMAGWDPVGNRCLPFRHIGALSLGSIRLHVLPALRHPQRYKIRVYIPDTWTLHSISPTRCQSVARRSAAFTQGNNLGYRIYSGRDCIYCAFNPLPGNYAALIIVSF